MLPALILLTPAAGLALAWAANTLGAYACTKGLGLWVTTRTPSTRALALTFDDGPHPVHTLRICDALEEYGARGTFFMVGERARTFDKVALEALARGHEVALHGHEHAPLWLRSPARVRADLKHGMAVLTDLGATPRWYRPPWGQCTLDSLRAAARLGLGTVLWSDCPEGFLYRPRVEELAAAIASAQPGAIVCLHDAGGHHDSPERVHAALRMALPRLADRGIECSTLSTQME